MHHSHIVYTRPHVQKQVGSVVSFRHGFVHERQGAAQIFSVLGFPWLSRVIRATVVVFWGRWGLPIPRRLPLMTCVGEPIPGVTFCCCCSHAIQPRLRASYQDSNSKLKRQAFNEMHDIFEIHCSCFTLLFMGVDQDMQICLTSKMRLLQNEVQAKSVISRQTLWVLWTSSTQLQLMASRVAAMILPWASVGRFC